MPKLRFLLLAGAAGALLTAHPAVAGGPNIAVCMTLSNAYSNCLAEQTVASRNLGRGPYRGGYGGYGYGPGYGGYGGPGGYGGWDDEDYDAWRAQRNAARANYARTACNGWLVQMQAANCFGY